MAVCKVSFFFTSTTKPAHKTHTQHINSGLRKTVCVCMYVCVCVCVCVCVSPHFSPTCSISLFFFLPSLPLHIPTFYHFLYSVISQLFSHCFIFFLSLSCSIPL